MKLFVYGTLENTSLVKQLLGYDPMSKKMILKGFKRVEISDKKETYPDLVRAKGESVLGVMYEVNEKDLEILDSWELNYNRVLIKGVYVYLLNQYRAHFHKFQDSFVTGIKTERNRKENYVEVFLNPSKKEYSSIPSYQTHKTVRAIITSKGNLYVWNAELLHSFAIHEIPLGKEGSLYTVEIEGKLGDRALISQVYISYLPQAKKLSPNSKFLALPVIKHLFSSIEFEQRP